MRASETPFHVIKMAHDFVESLTPDGVIGVYPVWHGWAIRNAFVKGYEAGLRSGIAMSKQPEVETAAV
jgi:hypothetical protein